MNQRITTPSLWCRMVSLLLGFVCQFAGGSAEAAQRERLAVMPLTAKRVHPETAAVLDELVVNSVHRTGRFVVLATADVTAMLGLEKAKDALGCSDVACAAEIGGALGVNYLVYGSVGRLGDEIIVSLSYIDIRRQEPIGRSQVRVPADESFYFEGIEKAVRELFGDRAPKKQIPEKKEIVPVQAPAMPSTQNKKVVLEASPLATPTSVRRRSLRQRRWERFGPWVKPAAITGGALVVAGGAMFFLRGNTSEEYLALRRASGSAREQARDDLQSALLRRNALALIGWSALGVGVGCAGFAGWAYVRWRPHESEGFAGAMIVPTKDGIAWTLQWNL